MLANILFSWAPLSDVFVWFQGQDHQERIQLVRDEDTGEYLNYRQLIKNSKHAKIWLTSAANEFGRLAQGVGGRIEGTDTIKFIHKHEVPKNKTDTYARFCCNVRPQKAEPNRTRMTVGGNLIHYPGELTTRTADLTTSKILWNSVVSTEDAKYMCIDIKKFYLGTPLEQYEYMAIPLHLFPQHTIDQYNLRTHAKDGKVYVEIRKAIYGLPQAGILANKLLRERLHPHGYYKVPHTPGLWKHIARPISFTLVVDDFGIKYVGKEHV